MANLEQTNRANWATWEQLVQLKGASAPGALAAAMYSIVVLERQKPRGRGDSSNRIVMAVKQTLDAIEDDSALARAHKEAQMEWAMANMPLENESPELVELYMREARETALRREQTTLSEITACRAWFAEGMAESNKI